MKSVVYVIEMEDGTWADCRQVGEYEVELAGCLKPYYATPFESRGEAERELENIKNEALPWVYYNYTNKKVKRVRKLSYELEE